MVSLSGLYWELDKKGGLTDSGLSASAYYNRFLLILKRGIGFLQSLWFGSDDDLDITSASIIQFALIFFKSPYYVGYLTKLKGNYGKLVQ